MRTAGVREARQNLSALLDEVKKGREVLITEHGRPVAKLVPPDRPRGKGRPDFAAIRRRMPVFDPPLSTTLAEVRDDARY
jgi:prevent-host-death family protein